MLRAVINGLSRLLKRKSGGNLLKPTAVAQPTSEIQRQSAVSTGDVPRRSSKTSLMKGFDVKPESFVHLSVTEESHIVVSPENFVRVRIWVSKTRDGANTYAVNAVMQSGNVGHVTLETGNIYASFWPEHGVSSVKENVSPEYIDSLQTDMERESLGGSTMQAPDHAFDFYSLDIEAIEDAFEQLKAAKDQVPWTLLGGALSSKGYSCSSLVLSLLERGGLNKLASQKIRGIIAPTSYFVASPNNLVNQLAYAQKIEAYMHPQTKTFRTTSTNGADQKEKMLITVASGIAKLVHQEPAERFVSGADATSNIELKRGK